MFELFYCHVVRVFIIDGRDVLTWLRHLGHIQHVVLLSGTQEYETDQSNQLKNKVKLNLIADSRIPSGTQLLLFSSCIHVLTQNTYLCIYMYMCMYFFLSGMQTSLGASGGTDETGQETAPAHSCIPD